MTQERVFDDTALRRELDYALPYDRLRDRHVIDAATPRPEVTNSVFEVECFADDDGVPALWDRWMLVGGCMSDCIVRNDRDSNYVMRVCMPDGKHVCSIIMHPNRCIVSGTRSILDLVTVCNTLTRCVRDRFKPHGASFHVGSFRGKLHNTVVRLNVDLPFAFARLEPLLRPNNAVRRSDEAAAALPTALYRSPFSNPAAAPAPVGTDRIPHYMLAINVLSTNVRKKRKQSPMLKMYEHKTPGGGVVSKMCLNGIRSIDRARDLLLEFYFFMMEHRDALLYTPDDLSKMQMLQDARDLPRAAGPRPKKRHRFD